MSAPFIERLRALRSLEDRLADALRTVADCDIENGGETVATFSFGAHGDADGCMRISLTHLAQELARDL